jgi:colanic acid biosynthesis protein WcaH
MSELAAESHIAEANLPPATWLPEQQFREATAALPLVSLDLCVVNEQQALLLGKRINEPAKGWWFTPGGCIRKHEPWQQALARIGQQEIGCRPEHLKNAELMGVYDHFYPTSAYSPELTTHYVNLPHYIALESGQLGLERDTQHTDWQWLALTEAAVSEEVHHYVRVYAQLLLARN